MRHLLAKSALSTAIIAGGVIAARACPQTTAMKDTSATASFHLAQAGSTGGSASGTAGNATSGAAAGGSAGMLDTGSRPGATIIPQDEPMRQPATPRAPGEPGVPGQTLPAPPK